MYQNTHLFGFDDSYFKYSSLVLHMKYLQTALVLYSLEVRQSFVIEMDALEAGEMKGAFFASLGN